MSATNPKWLDDGIQFPRLLAELRGVIEANVLQAVATSMDLTVAEVDQLLDRADAAWTRVKDGEGSDASVLYAALDIVISALDDASSVVDKDDYAAELELGRACLKCMAERVTR